MKKTFSIVIPSYNEEKTILECLESILSQRVPEGFELINITVVSSSDDDTNEIVRRLMIENKKIKLIVEDERKGKVSAINLFLRDEDVDICVLCDADITLSKHSLANLLQEFEDQKVGGTTAIPMVKNGKKNIVQKLGCLIWEMHRATTKVNGKFSLLWAFKNEIDALNINVGSDDSAVQNLILSKGFSTTQAENSIVYCSVPDNFGEYIDQRVRWRGCQLQMIESHPEFSIDTKFNKIITPLIKFLVFNPHKIPLFVLASTIELYIIYKSKARMKENENAFSQWEQIGSSR